MESVIEKIRQARDDDKKRKTGECITETIVDGCHVTMRFDAIGDTKAMAAIKSMLMSAHLDAVISSSHGG